MALLPDVRRSPTVRRVPRVESMMSRRFVRALPEAPIAAVARQLLKQGASCAALVDAEGTFHGFVSTHGVVSALVGFLHDEVPLAPASHYRDPETPILREDTPLLDALDAFVGAGDVVHALPVLREAEIVGIVRRLDAVRAAMDYVGSDKDLSPGTLYMSALKGSHEKPPY